MRTLRHKLEEGRVHAMLRGQIPAENGFGSISGFCSCVSRHLKIAFHGI